MTDVELLPLPAEDYVDDEGLWEKRYGPYSPEQMEDYARASIAHATAQLQAEIEALRGALEECHALSVERWRRLLVAEAENERLRKALEEIRSRS